MWSSLIRNRLPKRRSEGAAGPAESSLRKFRLISSFPVQSGESGVEERGDVWLGAELGINDPAHAVSRVGLREYLGSLIGCYGES